MAQTKRARIVAERIEAERHALADRLRVLFPADSTVYVQVTRQPGSGTRWIKVLAPFVDADGKLAIKDASDEVAKLLGSRCGDKGIHVPGYGFSASQHVVSHLAQKIHDSQRSLRYREI